MLEVEQTVLPPWNSKEFGSLCCLALITPYLFICAIYRYHFKSRNESKKLRDENDKPLTDHIFNWKKALFRPEGISAVVIYMAFGLFLSIILEPIFGIDLVPQSIKTLTLRWNPFVTILYFLVFDTLMYFIHYIQHHWRWLYFNTHSVHHTISSPTIIVALTGYFPDTALLIILPLHLTFYIVEYITKFIPFIQTNFIAIFIFATFALIHLHCIHSEFENKWDPFFRNIGIVNSWDHHVHHLRPRKNLAHFFVIIDKIFGTYNDPKTISKIRTQ